MIFRKIIVIRIAATKITNINHLDIVNDTFVLITLSDIDFLENVFEASNLKCSERIPVFSAS